MADAGVVILRLANACEQLFPTIEFLAQRGQDMLFHSYMSFSETNQPLGP